MDKVKQLADILYDYQIKEGWKNVSMETSLKRATDYYRIQGILEKQLANPVCPDCFDRGELRNDKEEVIGTCPCHY